MKYNLDKYSRKSIRLKEYDYSQSGAYFITICTQNKEYLFGEIVDGKMVMNDAGMMMYDEWVKTADIRSEIELGEFVVMPNHIHGIVVICRRGDRPIDVGAYGHTPLRSPSKTIGAMVRGFKSAVTKQINVIRNMPGIPVWQRNYYEHIIRDEQSLQKIMEYIVNNPMNWQQDEMNQQVGRGVWPYAPTGEII